jgi:hypothetical protein
MEDQITVKATQVVMWVWPPSAHTIIFLYAALLGTQSPQTANFFLNC